MLQAESLPQKQQSATEADGCFARARDAIVAATKNAKNTKSDTAPILTLLWNSLRKEQGGGGAVRMVRTVSKQQSTKGQEKALHHGQHAKESGGDLPRQLPFQG
eukprot:2721344-Ditylum_brightwellii.AAC.1